MAIIHTTQEEKFRESRFEAIWEKSLQDPISINKSWVWWHTSVIPAVQEADIEGLWSRPTQDKYLETLPEK
jgi:hypothetical protein